MAVVMAMVMAMDGGSGDSVKILRGGGILGAVWLRWPAQMARGTKGHLVAANRPCMKWPLLQPNGTSPSSGEAPCTCISQLHFSIVLAPESSVWPRHPSRPSFQPLGTPQNHHPP